MQMRKPKNKNNIIGSLNIKYIIFLCKIFYNFLLDYIDY